MAIDKILKFFQSESNVSKKRHSFFTNKYVCCICGQPIEIDDTLALEISVRSISGSHDCNQGFGVHSKCWKDVLHDSIPFDDHAFLDDGE